MNDSIAIKWYKQAVHDLDMAVKNIEIEGYDVTAFLSQQAVEKLLKAVIVLQGIKMPKTHHIDDLSIALQLPETIVDTIMDLSGDYTFARYPDVSDTVPFEQYTLEIALEKVQKARIIFEYFKDRFK